MPIKNPMNLAIKLALESMRNGEVPVGCVITDSKNKIISYSSNSMIKLNDPLAHAEIVAIRKACKKKKLLKLTDMIMYVTLQPCQMCHAAILQAGIKKVFFGAYTDSLKLYSNRNKKFQINNTQYNYFGGFKEKRCSNLLKYFFKKLR